MMKSKILSLIILVGVVLLTVFVLNKLIYAKNTTSASTVQNSPTISQSPSLIPSPSPTENLTPVDKSTIPILMYHHIKNWSVDDNDTEKGLSVPTEVFDGQMKAIYDAGYKTISLDKLFFEPQDKKIILTFDDGYIDNIENAAPILKKYGFSATIFVTTDFVGTDRYMGWEDYKKLIEDGWTIGGHTQNHPNLTTLDASDAKTQIEGCKKTLEEKLGVKVLDFSYPAGKFDEQIIEIIKNAGYQDAVTTMPGSANEKESKYELKRIRINGDMTIDGFKSMMEL